MVNIPFYEFFCSECNELRELLVKMGTEQEVCKVCGSEMKRKGGYKTVSTGLPNGHIAIRSKSRREN